MGMQSKPAELHHFEDGASGLDAFVAIDDLTLGPAFGGCRLRPYANATAASDDACRLAAGMTLKNALADIPFGGGKAVIREPAGSYDRQQLFTAFGEAIASLDGRYVTAMDAGTTTTDMDAIARSTRFVSGCSDQEGDPSPFTARGVAHGILAAVRSEFGSDLTGIRVAIQGVGHVGAALAQRLAAVGARLIVADVDSREAQRVAATIGAEVVHPNALLGSDCDVLAPCAFGGVLDQQAVATLRCRIVAGAANNQLHRPEVAQLLAARGVLYVPDFVINSGGVIHAALAWQGESAATIGARVDRIGNTVADILARAKAGNELPEETAVELAQRRLGQLSPGQKADPGTPLA